jgi:hypothetical protein
MSPSTVRALEILSDGEWHDGKEIVREMEKKVTPGVAFRKAETDRAIMSRRRNGEALERRRQLSNDALIAIGKRAKVRTAIAAMHRRGRWEIEPWPLPENAYRTGAFRIRDTSAHLVTFSELLARHGLHNRQLRKLMDQDPPVERIIQGRVTQFEPDAAEVIAKRVAEWRGGKPRRFSTAMKTASSERERRRRVQSGICGHCNQPAVLAEQAGDGELLCHPAEGMDCFTLVTGHHHPMQCRHCMPVAAKERSQVS